MGVAARIVIFMLTAQIKCQDDTSTCNFSRQRLNCSGESIPWERLDVSKSSVLYLYLDESGISNISCDNFQGLINLQRLSLEYNNIARIENSTFTPLRKLQYLHLAHNSIAHLDANTFKSLPKLVSVDLGNNRIRKINKGTFTNCSKLQQVHLSHNLIEEIHKDSFAQTSNLIRHFYGSDNKLSDLTFLKNLQTLVFVDLSQNRIVHIPAHSFLQMGNLTKLDLSYNELQMLHSGTFSELHALETLNLSYNKLKYLGEGPFNRVHNLKYLDLRNNSLKEFSYGTSFEKRNLSIYVDRNNWRCYFVHQLLRMPHMRLIWYEVNRNVSNVDGIACEDEVSFRELFVKISTVTVPATTSVTKAFTSTEIVSSSNTQTNKNKSVQTNKKNKTTHINNRNKTSEETVVSSTNKPQIKNFVVQTTPREVISDVSTSPEADGVTERNLRSMTVPEISINLFVVVITALGVGTIIISVVIIFVAKTKTAVCCDTHRSVDTTDGCPTYPTTSDCSTMRYESAYYLCPKIDIQEDLPSEHIYEEVDLNDETEVR